MRPPSNSNEHHTLVPSGSASDSDGDLDGDGDVESSPSPPKNAYGYAYGMAPAPSRFTVVIILFFVTLAVAGLIYALSTHTHDDRYQRLNDMDPEHDQQRVRPPADSSDALTVEAPRTAADCSEVELQVAKLEEQLKQQKTQQQPQPSQSAFPSAHRRAQAIPPALPEPIVPLTTAPISWPVSIACIDLCKEMKKVLSPLLNFWFVDWKYVDEFDSNRDALVISSGDPVELPPGSPAKRWFITGEANTVSVMQGNYDLVWYTVDDPAFLPPTFSHADAHAVYMPFYVMDFGERFRYSWDKLLLPKVPPPRRSKFCAFVQRNCGVNHRRILFETIHAARAVESIGTCMHNTDHPLLGPRADHTTTNHWADTVIDALKDYRFVLTIENTLLTGYITEKVVSPMLAGAIPIYFGAPDIAEHFNPKAFIDARTFKTYQALAEFVVALDDNQTAYEEMYREPWFHHNQLNKHFPDPILRPDSEALQSVRALYTEPKV